MEEPEEVMLVWVAMINGGVGVGKPNRSIARERSQLRQPRSNDVPSGSQQTDRWQDMFL